MTPPTDPGDADEAPAADRGAGAPDLVFYDAECGFCRRNAELLRRRDSGRGRLRLLPLDGPEFRSALPPERRAALPDSLVVVTPDGRILTRSDAALRCAVRTGGAFGLLARLGRLVPRRLRDAAYDGIARRRHHPSSPRP